MYWLLSWGPRIWPTILGLVVLATIATLRAVVRWRARRSGRRALRAAGPPAGVIGPTGARTTLEGRLVARDGTCVRFEDGVEAAAATVTFLGAAPPAPITVRRRFLAVAVAGEHVGIEGSVVLEAGSYESWRRLALGRLPQACRERVALAAQRLDDVTLRRRVLFRAVQDGDRVLVTGVVRAVAATDGRGSYRASAGELRLVGADGEPVRLVALDPARIRGPALRQLATAGLLAVAVFFASAFAAGHVAIRHAQVSEPGTPAHGRVVLAQELPWLMLAAATPFHRTAALQALEQALSEDAANGPSPTFLRLAEVLWRTPGQCYHVVRSLLDAGAVEVATRLARRCDYPYVLVDWATGVEDAQDASRILASSTTGSLWEAEAHLLAGRPDRAAAALLRRGEESTCVGYALRARAGDLAARSALEQQSTDGPYRETCTLLLADVLTGPERLAVLDRMRAPTTLSEVHPRLVDWVAMLLAVEADPTRIPAGLTARVTASPAALVEPGEALHGAPGLERAVLSQLEATIRPSAPQVALRLRLASAAAAFDAVAGDLPSARHWATLSLEDTARLDELAPLRWLEALVAYPEAKGLAAAIEIREGDPQRASDLLFGMPWHMWFEPTVREWLRPFGMHIRPPAAMYWYGPDEQGLRHGLHDLLSFRPERQLVTASDMLYLDRRASEHAPEALTRRIRRRRNLAALLLLNRDVAVPLALMRLDQVPR